MVANFWAKKNFFCGNGNEVTRKKQIIMPEILNDGLMVVEIKQIITIFTLQQA
jgi:hypothetical protein